MTITWRIEIDRALDVNRDLPQSRYVQLATLRADGRPANRTLVFRRFGAGTDHLCFATDLRSGKVEAMGRHPWAEACWYFPQTREQFRLLGLVTLVTDAATDAGLIAERKIVWAEIPEASRQSFTGPPPGATRADDAAFAFPSPDPRTPLATFALLLLEVVEVDHLELSASPHRRRRYRRGDGDWLVEAINP